MVIVVMGVVGAGKTTVGRLLADQLHWEFADADDFHSAESIEKIRLGIGLTDADRKPWLESLRQKILAWQAAQVNGVLACSALKRSYRDELQTGPDVHFVYLKGNPKLIAKRLSTRHGHFADEHILSSQIADLEEPADAIIVDISSGPAEIVSEILRKLGLA